MHLITVKTSYGLVRSLITLNSISKAELKKLYDDTYDRLAVYEYTGLSADEITYLRAKLQESQATLAEAVGALEFLHKMGSINPSEYIPGTNWHKASLLAQAVLQSPVARTAGERIRKMEDQLERIRTACQKVNDPWCAYGDIEQEIFEILGLEVPSNDRND